MPKTIALMTGGGDCPGLNAAIRTVVRAADQDGTRVIGILNGFEGLAARRFETLTPDFVRGMLRTGGTVLGSATGHDPLVHTSPVDGTQRDVRDDVRDAVRNLQADALIVIGGDGTHHVMTSLADGGPPLVGIPKTIDNDVHGTDYAIGFDTCAAFCTDAVGRMHATAASHQRVMLIEVMGRTAGWVALFAGMAGGADVVLLPERPHALDGLLNAIHARNASGRNFTIIVVAEGIALGVDEEGAAAEVNATHAHVSERLALALKPHVHQQVRSLVLGHLQRGGDPTGTDRVRAMMLAHTAYQAALQGQGHVMAALRGNSTTLVGFDAVVRGPRRVPEDHPLLSAAQNTGVYVGE